MDTSQLFNRYYFSRPTFCDGTSEFHRLCQQNVPVDGQLLEIGSGPSNPTSDFLSGLGRLSGIDLSPEVKKNRALYEAKIFDGTTFPFPNNSFDGCVSNYVLEHVENPKAHFSEIARVLRPGGSYMFRTPNLFHYAVAASYATPHWFHERVSNRLRGLSAEAHSPYRTYYRCNTKATVERISKANGFEMVVLDLIEKEPSYGKASPLLFYPMMAWERIVNASARLEQLRVNIFGVVRKRLRHQA